MNLLKKYKSVITFSIATILLFQPVIPVFALTIQAEEVPLSSPIIEDIQEEVENINEDLELPTGNVTIGNVEVIADFNPYVLGTNFQVQASVTATDIDPNTLTCYVTKHFDSVNPQYSNWINGTFNGTTCNSPALSADNTVMLSLNVKVTNGSDITVYGTPITRQSDVDLPFVTTFTLDHLVEWTIPNHTSLLVTAGDTVSPVIACEGRYRQDGAWSNWIVGTMLTTGLTSQCKVDVHSLIVGGSYDFQARVLDTVGHWNESWLLENLIVTGEVTEPEEDTMVPHVHAMLESQSFNEGSLIPDLLVTANDDVDVDKLCLSLKSYEDTPVLANFGCLEDGIVGNKSHTWNVKQLFNDEGLMYFDSAVLHEGKYEFEYYIIDASEKQSTKHTVIYNIVNVVPQVNLLDNQNVVVNEDAIFTGSFIDPSCIYIDNHCYVTPPAQNPDDSEWITVIDYGDENQEILFGNWNKVPGNITIPNHKYTEIGSYIVTLYVCESLNIEIEFDTELELTVNPNSEGECSSDTVTVNVGEDVPTVTITTNPGDSTTLQSITMNASVMNGNSPFMYTWSGGNFPGCTGTANHVVTPATPGTYTCNLQVMDNDGDLSNIATKSVTVKDTPVVNDLNPNVVLFGNSPSSNINGIVEVSIGTPFTITANLSNLGNPNYSFTFGGICTGAAFNTTNTALVSEVLNLSVGNYICTVAVSDADGDVTVASVPVNVGGVLGTQTVTNTDTPVEDDVDDDNVEGEIVQSCEERYTVSGLVFTDLDNDNEKDDNEVGTAGVLVQVYVEDGLDEVIIAEETTAANGDYQFELCPGSFNVRINSNDVPDNLEILGASDKDAEVIDTDIDGLNFILTETVQDANGFNWMIFAILLLVIAGGTGIYLYTGRNQE